MPLHLLVGLGNPGAQYVATRHNVGVWFVEAVARHYGASLHLENKFFGQIAQINVGHQSCWLLLPTTYMNRSGQAVAAMARFHKFSPESILVAHDELSFPAGVLRLKEGGGHGGHNGLRDIITQLNDAQFKRLRIGIGHPGEKSQVSDYVLTKPSRHDQQLIEDSLEQAIAMLPDLLAGDYQKAFRYFHNA